MRRSSTAWSVVSFFTVNAAGVVAFAYPFFGSAPSNSVSGARASDGPWLMALLSVLVLAVALAEAAGGRLDAKAVALLGVLAGLAALMRIPISLAGANLMFFLPIVGGLVFGPAFGFLLGSLAMAASAALTGGIGPWLPFQMWAAGWVGAGAACVKPLGDRLPDGSRLTVFALAAYGYLAGFAYGAVINLYFWPVTPVASELGWTPGLSLGESLNHYWSFYVLTSLAWDAFRALANALMILVLGRAAILLLRRYRRRFVFSVRSHPVRVEPAPAPEVASV